MKKRNKQQASDFEAYSRENVIRYHKKDRRRKFRKHFLRTFVIVLVLLVATAGVAGALWVKSLQDRMTGTIALDEELQSVLVDQAAPEEPFYMLLLGCDGRPGESAYRSDTIILVRVDPVNKTVTMLSIPRDTMVTYKGSTMKINAAHFYDGPAGSVAAVSELCGVPISHYAEVNFEDFAIIVDAVGGVEVDVDTTIDDPHLPGIYIEPGLQTLSGEEAMAYCRSRYFADGDYSRMRHQRTFLTALMGKVLSADPVTLVNLINSFADVVSTDMSLDQIVSLAYSMQGINIEEDVHTAHVPSYPAMVDEVSYVIAYDDQLAEMMEVIDSGGDPSAEEASEYEESESDESDYGESEYGESEYSDYSDYSEYDTEDSY